ncbi:MAG: SidA/IucD/PvdA family monooxygenase [Limimaricola sp.]|uniref:flavin-containing monooxygenase n=1 Tax=Limimaricola sp. TaxID=2211665 RepID=UPI001D9E3F53|nr:NAD(P)/FAD-dependent oxidoreductase [Limimaricola sp.]MBI1416049.1 SidA/IucD/PvdA family monooxygenase [Limimaricola sp.]
MKAIVIGAGPAGLASAACLQERGISATIYEAAAQPGQSWRNHYDRLELHTVRGRSGLPGLPMPADYPRYPKRADVVRYLDDYARHFGLAPVCGTPVLRVVEEGGTWQVETAQGPDRADVIVFATGMVQLPNYPDVLGLDGFAGRVMHSADYRNAAPFAGQRVLVVGFGNSGGDIALDLMAAGCAVDMAVRGPVNLLPKELFGIPITSFGLLRKIFPYRVADALTAPILRWKLGTVESYGLMPAGKGPVAQIVEDGRIPLIDVGTLRMIRAGHIGVRPGLAAIDGARVSFADGKAADYDAIMLATGYRVDLTPILGDAPDVLENGRPRVSGGPTARRGLYFCSYTASPNGQLRQIGIEAREIAADAARLAV